MYLLQRSVAADQAPRLQQLTAEVTSLRGHKREAGAARRRADLDKSQAQEALASAQAERQALQEYLAEARERKASGPQVRLPAAGRCSGVACPCCCHGRQGRTASGVRPQVRRLWWPGLALQSLKGAAVQAGNELLHTHLLVARQCAAPRPPVWLLAVALAVGQLSAAAVNAGKI